MVIRMGGKRRRREFAGASPMRRSCRPVTRAQFVNADNYTLAQPEVTIHASECPCILLHVLMGIYLLLLFLYFFMLTKFH